MPTLYFYEVWTHDRSSKMVSFTWYTLLIRVPSETIRTFPAWKPFGVFFCLVVFKYFLNFVIWSPGGVIGIVCVVFLFFPFVLACSPLVGPERQVRHHQTGGPHTPTVPAPPLLLWPLFPPQQGPQAVWGLWNGAWIASLPVPICTFHSIPILCVFSLGLLH